MTSRPRRLLDIPPPPPTATPTRILKPTGHLFNGRRHFMIDFACSNRQQLTRRSYYSVVFYSKSDHFYNSGIYCV
nr:hypothetical transcript [Hymenolepis microstoma]